jgi:hypothetical protein
MADSLEVVSLVKCGACDGLFINPAPLEGDPKHSAMKHAMRRRLELFMEELGGDEEWHCPDCHSSEWLDYMPEIQEEEDAEINNGRTVEDGFSV